MFKNACLLLGASLLACTLSGCAALRSSKNMTRPTLEGGQMYFASSGDPAPMLSEMSKIDLIYELDPKKFGSCHVKQDEPLDPPPSAVALPVELTAAAKLRCALDGFYSPRYFEGLTQEQKAALEVSNVAFAYAEKQSGRIAELAKAFDASLQNGGDAYYSRVKGEFQTKVIDVQINDLTARVAQAQKSSAFLEFQRRRRNQVQSSFMAASDAACDYYKRNLNRDFSRSNFAFGSVATIAGGLGAILTDEDASRALSGLAGITSGIRAEYNDAFFRNKVVELLTKAIAIAQERKREEVRRRGVQITADYSMEDALNDAVLYNSQCSLIAGLQETSESLQVVADPGLKWMANAFGGAASKVELTQKLFESLGQAVGTMQQVQKSVEDQNAVLQPPAPEKKDPPAE